MATESNPFSDVKKMIEQFKLPGVDMTAIVEALVDANKAAYEAMQAVARKQTEMMTQAMQACRKPPRAPSEAAWTRPSRPRRFARPSK